MNLEFDKADVMAQNYRWLNVLSVCGSIGNIPVIYYLGFASLAYFFLLQAVNTLLNIHDAQHKQKLMVGEHPDVP